MDSFVNGSPSLHLVPSDGRYDCLWNQDGRGYYIGYIIERQVGGFQFAPLVHWRNFDDPYFTGQMLMKLAIKLSSMNNGTAPELKLPMPLAEIVESSDST